MAKGQMRSTREAKKPKQGKPKTAPAQSPFASQQKPPGGSGRK